jgi:hypothetical protein
MDGGDDEDLQLQPQENIEHIDHHLSNTNLPKKRVRVGELLRVYINLVNALMIRNRTMRSGWSIGTKL